MSTVATVALDGPPPALRFKRHISVVDSVRELWGSRELIRTLAERDYRIRYKQAVLGVAWAVLTPLALTLVLTLFFQRIAHANHGSVPYPVFAAVGLLPWTFFSNSLNVGGMSLVTNIPVLNKVYCPREVFPIESMAVAGLDTVMSLIGVAALFAIYGVLPTATIVFLPLIIVVQLVFTLALTLLAAIVIVFLRDVRYALPVLLQLGLFACPIAYSIDDVPANVRTLYQVINPLAVIIDGYRRTILYGQAPNWTMLGVAALVSTGVFSFSWMVFKRLEGGIADVA